MNADGSKNWLRLYREAVLEPDPTKSKVRIAQAHKAIELRARELWYAGSAETAERHRLDAALNFLTVLHAVGSEHL